MEVMPIELTESEIDLLSYLVREERSKCTSSLPLTIKGRALCNSILNKIGKQDPLITLNREIHNQETAVWMG